VSFAELREAGFPLDSFDDEALLWTSPFEPDFEAGAAVLAAQANFIPSGCPLVLSLCSISLRRDCDAYSNQGVDRPLQQSFGLASA